MKKIKILFWLALIGVAASFYYFPDKTSIESKFSKFDYFPPIIGGMLLLALVYFFMLSMKSAEDEDDGEEE